MAATDDSDPFDLEALRLTQDFAATLGVKKALSRALKRWNSRIISVSSVFAKASMLCWR